MRYELLSTVAQINMGQSPPSSSYNLRGQGLPFFQGKADFGDLYPKVRVFCTDPLKVAEAGDILISVRAPVGPTNINLEKSCIGRGLAALRCRTGFETKYLLYFLRFYEPRLAQVSTGSTFGAISRDDLENIRIPILPPLERKRIAAILEEADRLCRQRRYALELSNTYLQSVFLEMFGDPERNPKGWAIDLLGNLGAGKNAIVDGPFGASINTRVDYIFDGEIPVIRTKNIRPFEFIEEDLKFISREKFDTIKRSKVVPGDIILTKVGTIGHVCIFPHTFEEAVLSTTGSCKITPDVSKVDRIYLAHHLYAMKTYMNQIASEGVQPFLNMETIKGFRINLPPLSLQQKFAQIAQKFEHLHAQQREAERQAEHLFQTLLHQAFQGNLDLGSRIVQDEDMEDSIQSSVGDSQLTGSYVQLQMKY
jgi:type I restriction enzyme S subunit